MMPQDRLEALDPRKYILIKGARVHNLKNIDIAIKRNKLVIITGLSGSGKSSLAFDTIFADGQRRYVESLSSYARQFLGRMQKPEVDYIKGISPAIAIEQKVNSRNPRSTVGTTTEIYDYLKLLFARIGKTYSPVSGNQVRRHVVADVVDFIKSLEGKPKILITSPLKIISKRKFADQLTILLQQGFTRVFHKNEIIKIEDILASKSSPKESSGISIVIDRLAIDRKDTELQSRLSDSVQTAFYEGDGRCFVEIIDGDQTVRHEFSNRFKLDGITFEEPSENFFSFNNPFGACKRCEGFGNIIGIDGDLVIPDKSLSVYQGAVAPWKGEKMGQWKELMVMNAYKFNFPVHKPYFELTQKQKDLLWTGNQYFEGINEFFRQVEEQTYKIQYRVMLSRYRGKTLCPECKGTRLRSDANFVKITGKSISELVLMPLEVLKDFFGQLKLNPFETQVSKRILIEINNRLDFLCDVGLGYLTLNRLSSSLSGGES
jgi:excinuclease ABC subunit A